MIFGPTPLDAAEGALLAHSHRVPGRVLTKGTRLDAPAIAALRAAGILEVIAARLDPGDLLEDEAATRLAGHLLAPNLRQNPAATGRVNLVAERHGLLRVDAAVIERINLIDEAQTVATLPDWSVVAPGDMVATIKVIPFAVAAEVQARVEVAAQGGAFALHPFTPRRVGLVISEIGTPHTALAACTRASASSASARACATRGGPAAARTASRCASRARRRARAAASRGPPATAAPTRTSAGPSSAGARRPRGRGSRSSRCRRRGP